MARPRTRRIAPCSSKMHTNHRQTQDRNNGHDTLIMPSTLLQRPFGIFLIFGLLLLPAFTDPAAAQNPHGKRFGSWQIGCNSATGAPSQCQMVQNVFLKETGQPVLQSVIGFIEGAPAPIGVFILPLGIYLPHGLTLQVDKGQTYEMALEICSKKGCRVRFSIDAKLLQALKGGSVAEVGFQTGSQKPLKIPLSLKGFTAALGQLR